MKTFTFNDKHCYGQYVIGEFNLNGIKSIVNPYNIYFKKYVVSPNIIAFLMSQLNLKIIRFIKITGPYWVVVYAVAPVVSLLQ